ncbi:MAG: hypothetical protein HY270_20150 [Deltaproteobacteria bacterium]|nr:hypothetical protein [Deltaproteobacteria bacterium]
MFQVRDEKWLLGEVRKAMTSLSLAEQAILIERFGLHERLELGKRAGDLDLPPESSRRWMEIRALRKLRGSGLGARSGVVTSISKGSRRREAAVIVPLKDNGSFDRWPPRSDDLSDAQPPDNILWDEV